MSNLYFYKNGIKFHVMSDEEIDEIKKKHKFKWVDIVGNLCGLTFPEILKITDETKNNYILDMSYLEKDLEFYVIIFTIENRNYFSVMCNKEVLKKKRLPFDKYFIELSCSHNFVYDKTVDDISSSRFFCPTCLEE